MKHEGFHERVEPGCPSPFFVDKKGSLSLPVICSELLLTNGVYYKINPVRYRPPFYIHIKIPNISSFHNV